MPDYLKVLIPSILGFIATICAAFVSARWAVRRAYEERWWERKLQAYIEIIEALHDMLRYSELCAQEYFSHTRREHPKEKEFADKYSQAHWKIQRMTDIGAFVISDSASDTLQKLRDRPKLDWEDAPSFEIREEESASYREVLVDIRKCAKMDLRV